MKIGKIEMSLVPAQADLGKSLTDKKRDRCKCRKKDGIPPLQKVNKQKGTENVRDIQKKSEEMSE